MRRPLTLTRDLVLLGGGHAHALVLRDFAMRPMPGVRLTLIDPEPVAIYSGMLPAVLAGLVPPDRMEIDLHRLARLAGARLVTGHATAIDRAARKVTVPGRPAIAWDVLSVDVGTGSVPSDLPGAREHGVPVKPLGALARRWAALCDAPTLDIVVIGAGLAGTELILALAAARRGRPGRLSLVDRDMGALDPGLALGRRLRAALTGAGVSVLTGSAPVRLDQGGLDLASGARLSADLILVAAGSAPAPWLATTGLADAAGFLRVDETLCTADPAIFAAGDCAAPAVGPRPKSGYYAVRAAPVLARNLRAALATADPATARLARFRPAQDHLRLVLAPGPSAIAAKWGFAARSRAFWSLKHRIDSRFLARFSGLPAMPPDLPQGPGPGPVAAGLAMVPNADPACAGCGAKVPRTALTAALDRAAADRAPRPDVTISPGDDAAVIDGRQVLTTDHLSAVTEDPVLMARIATVHALGDVWAMGAVPQAALLSVTLPPLSDALATRTLAEITGAAQAVLQAEGAVLAGGHTTFGTGLTIGLSLTGLLNAAPIGLAGGRPGDLLVLTKALGVGTLLAGGMRGLAKGRDLAAAHAAMIVPQGQAAALLAAAGARAMTDVTGFGLAGHLANLAEASGLAAQIDLAHLPLLAGAAALAGQGVRSSLWAGNRAAVRTQGLDDSPAAALVFDPQTCGGLLAAIPEGAAEQVVARLRTLAFPAAVIGRLDDGPAGLITFRPEGR
jgi:selenide, water dikinase